MVDVKRLMAIDYGERRIGIALSDEEQTISFPYRTIDTRKQPDVMKEIAVLVRDQNVGIIIIGNPTNVEGGDSEKSKVIRNFISKLQNHISIPIKLWDESYTTQAALKVLVQSNRRWKKNRNKVDQIAASLLLKDYLEHH
ncbi:MAG TPA: Holliday junction resolvase RuvX [Candidatus Cloacimonetes bacterium]|nr:Holliday junction resolvase RuvX [Candidatus Cloacimonadota bacterium]HEX37371.1 Holliday junction resolvase RuvX [Candidatus Cloacimonadota bacterium]